MALSRTLRLTHRTRRTLTSALFGLTFFASILTVSASDVLPCPAHSSRNRFADGGEPGDHTSRGGRSSRPAVVEKRPRRWIEEKSPHLSNP
ncbi:hypothetical protein HETIRDRAFT_312706 [Heterobasidion irregulare TC 32-1]|uniref:Uncharacterized protein n=1 Tax=Heterobasidion irregulare (strain TC 32-1) TaxID=747525 RepID=W4KG97_HETIT|nr:uncharacterized protein HETIRDRAFT_312706 [Heterobasidion irregulare TC 32-1]ETW84315.1 hypothetical protein HETIRDRAFT_312706 [Heterobasidion irregulare TC 32-1]